MQPFSVYNHRPSSSSYMAVISIGIILLSACDETPPMPNTPPPMVIRGGTMMEDIPLAGTPNNGGMSAGEMSAGEVMAGEMTAGEVMAGEMTAGEVMAGEMTAGEVMAGEMTAGEVMAGEMTAGEVMAGEMTAGEAMAGEMTAGEMNQNHPQAGDIIRFDGTVPAEGVGTHSFSVNTELGVRVRVIGRDGLICPEGADSLLNLYKSDRGVNTLVAANDDYTPDHLCSEINTVITSGDYIAEVSDYNGQAIEDYILEISFYPALESGALCDSDSPSAGVCPDNHLCLGNVCLLTQPQIDLAQATKNESDVYLYLEGNDADRDAVYLNLRLYDETGTALILDDFEGSVYYTYIPDEAAPIYTNQVEFAFNLISPMPSLDLAVELGIEVEDMAGNLSDLLIIPLEDHLMLAELDPCDPSGFGGLCDQNLICMEDEETSMFLCQQGSTPSISNPTLYLRDNALVISAEGIDQDQDITALGVTLYNQQGEAIFGASGAGREVVEHTNTRSITDSESLRYYTILDGNYAAITSAAEVSLIDRTGLESMRILATLTQQPSRELTTSCDPLILDNRCVEGVCYPNPTMDELSEASNGLCRLDYPSRGEYCDFDLGCADGFLCYGPHHNSALTDRYNVCMRACDDNAEENGCQQDEFCLPDFDWASLGVTDIESPGVCLISDQCVSGDEANSCTQPDSTCLRVSRITLCVDLSEVPNESRGEAGDTCSGINQPCGAGFVCETGICRRSCEDDSICLGNETCRLFDEVYYDDPTEQYAACFEICDPVSQNCSEVGEVCTLYQSESSEGRFSLCVEDEVGELTDGEVCDPQGTDNYWGNCEASYFCAGLFTGDLDQCLPICTNEDTTQCTEGRVCALDILGTPNAGLCTGECNYFTGVGCDNQQSCLIGFQGPDANQDIQMSGHCVDNSNSGTLPTSSPCVFDAVNITSNCSPGHICFDLNQDLSDECVALCQAGSQENSCPLNSICINSLGDGEYVFGDNLSTLGICLPQ
jgi:hypothetical protein